MLWSLFAPAIMWNVVSANLIKEFEKELYVELLAGYESLARPVERATDPVNVSLGIALQQIVDIVEKEQMIILNVWLTFRWYDYRLRWEPAEHGNVTELRLPPGKIWKPDVLLYNGAGENFDPIYQSNVIIKNTGQLEWIPPGIIKATCKIDITWFPFDDQVCDLKYGSWTFSGYMLLLDVGEVNIATYTQNGEWTLIVTPIRNEFKYDCCPDPYYDVTFRIWVRRRTLYYLCNMILPCVLISFMTLLDFTLPPESGEKLGLGVIIFMTLCFFLITTSNTLPQTSEAVPLIVIYFSAIMMVVSASVVFTVLVLNIHHRKSEAYEMSQRFRTVFIHWLPWLLRMKRPGYVSARGRLVSIDAISTDSASCPSKLPQKSLLTDVLDLSDSKLPFKGSGSDYSVLLNNPSEFTESETEVKSAADSFDCPSDLSLALGSPEETIASHLLPVLLRTFRELQVVTNYQENEEDERHISEDWKFAAMVVDRLSLIIFSSILVISTGAILFKAPHVA